MTKFLKICLNKTHCAIREWKWKFQMHSLGYFMSMDYQLPLHKYCHVREIKHLKF